MGIWRKIGMECSHLSQLKEVNKNKERKKNQGIREYPRKEELKK